MGHTSDWGVGHEGLPGKCPSASGKKRAGLTRHRDEGRGMGREEERATERL